MPVNSQCVNLLCDQINDTQPYVHPIDAPDLHVLEAEGDGGVGSGQ